MSDAGYAGAACAVDDKTVSGAVLQVFLLSLLVLNVPGGVAPLALGGANLGSSRRGSAEVDSAVNVRLQPTRIPDPPSTRAEPAARSGQAIPGPPRPEPRPPSPGPPSPGLPDPESRNM